MLQTVFDKQYKLTLKERVIEGDEDEDDYYILNVKLTNHGIAAAISTLNLTEEQMERYRLLLETRGNKPDIFGDNIYANPEISEKYQDYAVPGGVSDRPAVCKYAKRG